LTKREVLLSRTALRELERLPREAGKRIRAKLKVLVDDPFRARAGADIRLLWGQDEPPLYRLRVGDYRVLYFVLEKEIRVTEILHRSQAYRGID
jgi:mRNA interferase RelE/StbE